MVECVKSRAILFIWQILIKTEDEIIIILFLMVIVILMLMGVMNISLSSIGTLNNKISIANFQFW